MYLHSEAPTETLASAQHLLKSLLMKAASRTALTLRSPILRRSVKANSTTKRTAAQSHTPAQGVMSKDESLLLHISVASAITVSLFIIIIGSSFRGAPPIAIESFDVRSRHYQGVNLSALSPLERQVHHTNERAKKEVAAKIHFLTQYIEEFSPKIDHSTAKRIALDIYTESHRAGVDPFLIASMIESESSFRPKARSSRSAYGLMQVQPITARFTAKKINARWKGSQSLLAEQRYNIKIGIGYLKYLESRFDGDTKKALMAYNWGPTNLQAALKGKKSIPHSVLKYAHSIISRQRTFSQTYQNSSANYMYMNVNFVPETLWEELAHTSGRVSS